MPPKTKATKNTKKGKAMKKRAPRAAPIPSNTDWTSGGKEEEASIKRFISNMASMMMALMIRMDDIDGSPKRTNVASQEAPQPISQLPAGVHQEPLLAYKAPPQVRRDWMWPTCDVCPYICQTSQIR